MKEDTKKLVFMHLNASGIIDKDEIITLEELIELSKYSRTKVGYLFSSDKSIEYKITLNCFRCGDEGYILRKRDSILSFITQSKTNRRNVQGAFKETLGSGLCQKCTDIIKIEKEEKEKEDKERIKEETYEFIFNYLNPRWKLDNSVKHFERISFLREMKRKIDWEWFAEEAKDLAYKYYVKTPYWQIISTEVKKRADFKCQLCNHKGFDLNAHHRNYKILGHELDNMKDLICLCAKCHKKHHGIGESE